MPHGPSAWLPDPRYAGLPRRNVGRADRPPAAARRAHTDQPHTIRPQESSMTTYLADSAETRHVDGPEGERFAYRRFGREGTRPLVMHMRLRGTIDHWDPALLDL